MATKSTKQLIKKQPLIKVLKAYEQVIRDHEMVGSLHPDERDDVEAAYKEWQKFWKFYAKGRMICLKQKSSR